MQHKSASNSVPYAEVRARALARPGVRFWYTVYAPWYWLRRLWLRLTT
jgi:hypothetical protein